MKQIPKVPEISPCWCGANARLIDWEFRDNWRVMCDKNHTITGEFITQNRAVHRWNNEIKKIAARHAAVRVMAIFGEMK